MRLTAVAVRSLVLPANEADRVIFDSDVPGLGVRLRSSGSKTWVCQYAIAGRTRRVTLGPVSVLDPGAARDAARTILAAVRLGRDPAAEKILARAKAAETFGAILPRFLDRQRTRLKPGSYAETERHLLTHWKPVHGRSVDSIDRRAIAFRLAELAETRGPVAANRARASLSAFFTWAAREGLIDNNPVSHTNKAHENAPRERTPTDDELAVIYRAAGDDQYGAIVKLLMLLGMRRTEIGGLRRSEIDFEAATITLPPERTKNRREFIVPLSEPALQILAAQPHRVEADGTPRDLIFGHGKNRGYQNWTHNKVDFNARITAARNGEPLDPWTPHDFRRSLSTQLHERFNVAPHVVEAILGHVGGHKAGVAGTYNRAVYLAERRRALELWARHITELASGKQPKAKIVKLR